MMIRERLAGLLFIVCIASFIAPAYAQQSKATVPQAFKLEGDAQGTHDPSIIKEGDTWYVFSTTTGRGPSGQIPIRCSNDLKQWKRCGNVLAAIPDWIKKDSPATTSLWAPDISYFDRVYHLYYAYSLFGKNTSGIALLTNKTLDPGGADFHWQDEGLVLRSKTEDDFNAIDPNLAMDAKGGTWLVFGSFWSGIKMRRIDRASGKLSTQDTNLYSLARRSPEPSAALPGAVPPPSSSRAIEAPFVVHHGRYYYLFVSFDFCCRGARSTYRTMVGRSRKITGPYFDATGKPMMQGGGTEVLVGNTKWVGPGGESVLMQKSGDIIVFHAYDAHTGAPSLQVSSIAWVKGWPKAALDTSP
jgi:arabinan endo-1,5-alpha-L-arabinosidase